jgi:hypothetical protein
VCSTVFARELGWGGDGQGKGEGEKCLKGKGIRAIPEIRSNNFLQNGNGEDE